MPHPAHDQLDAPRSRRQRLPKGDKTRKRILDAAETLFADRGYNGVSVRDITGRVGANVASIRYYFGSKEALFSEALVRRLEPINAMRRERLALLLQDDTDEHPSVEQLLGAVIQPLVEHIRDDPSSSSWLKLVARSRIESGTHWLGTRDLHRHTFAAFVAAFAKALPGLSRKEVAQRMFWVTGAVANSLIDTRDLKRLGFSLLSVTERPDVVLPMMINFYAAAMRAPATGPAARTTASRTSRA